MDAGIKQNVSHLIGITNVMHDADALAWFKANNPFIEPDVLSQIGAHTDIYFTNLLYFRPEEEAAWYGEAQTNKTAYTYLLEEFAFEHLRGEIELEFIPCAIFNTYADFFAEVRSQMPKPLADWWPFASGVNFLPSACAKWQIFSSLHGITCVRCINTAFVLLPEPTVQPEVS